MARSAIVLFAHGARDPDWARPFGQLALELGERLPGERVALAYLELMKPSLAECAAALYADGIRKIRVVPLFFGSGGHVREDLPALISKIKEAHRDVEITADAPIGEQQEVIVAIARAIAGR